MPCNEASLAVSSDTIAGRLATPLCHGYGTGCGIPAAAISQSITVAAGQFSVTAVVPAAVLTPQRRTPAWSKVHTYFVCLSEAVLQWLPRGLQHCTVQCQVTGVKNKLTWGGTNGLNMKLSDGKQATAQMM